MHPWDSEDLPSQLYKCVLNCACIFWWGIPMPGSYIHDRKWIYLHNHQWRREHNMQPLLYLFNNLYGTNTVLFKNSLLRYPISNIIWQERNARWRKKIVSSKKETLATKHNWKSKYLEGKLVKKSNINKTNKPSPPKLPGYFPEVNSLHCLLQMRFNIFPEFAGVTFICCTKPESTLLNI